MNLADLIDAFRTRSDDAAGTESAQLWTDDEVTLYLNEAVNEAAERALLIRDSTTPAVCSIAITTTDTDYALNPFILAIDRAKLASDTDPLIRTTIDELDASYSGWETAVTGKPQGFIEDNGRIRLFPMSNKVDTLALVVYRLPLVPLKVETDVPEIHARHHLRLVDWALRCAYLKQDSETLDKQKAAQYEAMFEASFGKRPDANVQRKQREHRPTVSRINW